MLGFGVHIHLKTADKLRNTDTTAVYLVNSRTAARSGSSGSSTINTIISQYYRNTLNSMACLQLIKLLRLFSRSYVLLPGTCNI